MDHCRIDIESHMFVSDEMRLYRNISVGILLGLGVMSYAYFDHLTQFPERIRLLVTVIYAIILVIGLSYVSGAIQGYLSFRYIVNDAHLADRIIRTELFYDRTHDRLVGQGFFFDYGKNKFYADGRSRYFVAAKVRPYFRILRLYALNWS